VTATQSATNNQSQDREETIVETRSEPKSMNSVANEAEPLPLEMIPSAKTCPIVLKRNSKKCRLDGRRRLKGQACGLKTHKNTGYCYNHWYLHKSSPHYLSDDEQTGSATEGNEQTTSATEVNEQTDDQESSDQIVDVNKPAVKFCSAIMTRHAIRLRPDSSLRLRGQKCGLQVHGQSDHCLDHLNNMKRKKVRPRSPRKPTSWLTREDR